MTYRGIVLVSLLQVPSVAGGHPILGKGFNVVADNLWESVGVYAMDVYGDTTPDECFEVSPCSHTSVAETQFLSDTRSWSEQIENDFGLDGSGGFKGVGVTVSASFGDTSTLHRTSDRKSVYVKTYNRQSCHQMRSECCNNATYLRPILTQVASSLPTDASDATTMDSWVKLFIKRFGSHVSVQSESGAMVHSLTSVDVQTDLSKDCLLASACLTASYMQASGSLCSNHSDCQTSDGTKQTMHTSCTLVGGDPSTSASSVCSSKGSSDILNTFLSSGDMSSSSSVIRYTFKPIADIFKYSGKAALAKALTKAVEYQACTAPRYSWTKGPDGDFSCKCILSCGDRGTLDEEACTCKCKGDDKHGWTGGTCTDTYGTCQAGQGSGNPGSASKCAFDNTCSSWTSHNTCKPTDVCCLTDFKGKCCPFGNSCHCGVSNCDCVPPPSNSSLIDLLV